MIKIFMMTLLLCMGLLFRPELEAGSKDCAQRLFQLAFLSTSILGGHSEAWASLIRSETFATELRIDSRAYDLWNNRWPNVPMSEIQPRSRSDSLVHEIHQNHKIFSDFFYFASPAERRDPGFWQTDRLLDSRLVTSVAIAGGWNSVWLTRAFDLPPESIFGIVTYYDETHHTPGLYQFTTVDYTQANWFVIVTHYAWITPEASTDGLEAFEPFFGQERLIPTPGSLSLLGLAAVTAGSRRRRD